MDKPPPPEDQVEPFAPRSLAFLVGGLVVYGLGFLLLWKNRPDLAPVIIVAGILSMAWAFLS